MGIFLRKLGVKQLRNLLVEWFFVEDGRIRNIWASGDIDPNKRAPCAAWKALRRRVFLQKRRWAPS